MWQQRFLQATSNFSTVENELTASLRGAVLDIVLVPSEDDAFIAVSLAGETYIGGLVGEVIGLLAGDGGFGSQGSFRAVVLDAVFNACSDDSAPFGPPPVRRRARIVRRVCGTRAAACAKSWRVAYAKAG